MRHDKIHLAHGGGGRLSAELVRSVIISRFANPVLDRLEDSAVLRPGAATRLGAEGWTTGRLAFTTDSYVVSPLFFPGGDIGDLAVCGTVNDLAMSGAEPRWISLSLILEEGLPIAELERVLDSVQSRAHETAVDVVCGDTKVVPRGAADKLYVNTAGLGVIPEGVDISSHNAAPGDRLVLSGVVGLHGLAVMLSRGDFRLRTPIVSDVAPLHEVVSALLAAGVEVHALRDLTRGGLAMALHDIAGASGVGLEVDESAVPRTEAQTAACELLGLDVLQIACEGRFLAVVAEHAARAAVEIMHRFDVSAQAAVIGTVKQRERYPVELVTPIGSRRVLTPPSGEQMPRIC